MKTERRHELKENDLADWLGHYIELLRPYSKTILAVAILACAGVIAGTIISRDQAAQNNLAWNAFFNAFAEQDPDRLGNVADDFAGKAAALWAKQSEADIKLAEGVRNLFVDRKAAEEALEEARRSYSVVQAEAGSNAMLKQRALFGLAQVHESRSELDEAREFYAQLAANYPATTLGTEAQRRAEELDNPEVERWYNWFANQKPKPRLPSDPHSALDALDLPDDLGSLSDRPDISFPRFGDSEEMKPADDSTEATTNESPEASTDEPGSDPAPEPPADESGSDAAKPETPAAAKPETPAAEKPADSPESNEPATDDDADSPAADNGGDDASDADPPESE